MFSTPLICCSIGVATVAATTSALAPGYWPETLMIGGAISGYCATGSRENDTPPRITNTIETTAAKIGRSMKKCEMRIQETFHRVGTRASSALSRTPSPLWGGRGGGREVTRKRRRTCKTSRPPPLPLPTRGRGNFSLPRLGFVRPFGFCWRVFLLRRHFLARARAHQAVDDDAIGGGEPVLDHAQTAVDLAEGDVFLLHHVAVIDDQHELAHLLGADRGVGNEQRAIGRRAGHPDAAEHAGRKDAVAVGEDGAAADGARRTVDDVVDEIDLALVREILLVDQLECDRNIAMKTGDVLARRGEAHVAQIRRLVE